MADTSTQYKVKGGDTLWDIAASFGIPAAQRDTALWKSWGFTGDVRQLPIGFSLNIPAPSAPPASSTAVIPPDDPSNKYNTVTGKLNPNYKGDVTDVAAKDKEEPEDDFSASFSYLSQTGKDLAALGKEMAGDFAKPAAPGSPEELASAGYKAKEAAITGIKTETARSKEEIQDALRLSEVSKSRALEQIAASPAASRAVIDSFVVQSDNFTNAINRSIERLQADENNAIAQANYAYANEIHQQKLDYYNMLQTNLQNSINFTTSAFNMLLSGKQYERQLAQDEYTKASDFINTTIKAYAGSGETIDTLSPENAKSIMDQAAILGLDKDTLDRMFAGTQDVQIIHDTETGVVMGIDKNTGDVVFSKLMPGRTGTKPAPAVTLQGTLQMLGQNTDYFLREDVDYKATGGAKVSIATYSALLDQWAATYPPAVKYFFLNYPMSMVKDDKSQLKPYTGALKGNTAYFSPLYMKVKNQYDTAMKVSIMDAALDLTTGWTPTTTE